jgi:hypothetical protein
MRRFIVEDDDDDDDDDVVYIILPSSLFSVGRVVRRHASPLRPLGVDLPQVQGSSVL